MQCPQCQKQVAVTEAQFGALFTCPQCYAVYFINFDGQPEYGDMSQETPSQTTEFQSETVLNNDFNSETEVSVSTPELYSVNQALNHDENSNFENTLDENIFDKMAPNGVAAFNEIVQDIQSYGNQDENISNINYDLKITGLDTKEVIELFKEAIEDSKFGWIPGDIMSSIKQGACEIKNLNPIAAFVLAKRIQFFDLEMEWSQNVETY